VTKSIRLAVLVVFACLYAGMLLAGTPIASPSSTQAEPASPPVKITDTMKRDAAAIDSLVKADLAKAGGPWFEAGRCVGPKLT